MNKFLKQESGQSIVEYILLISLIALWVLQMAKAFGVAMDITFVAAYTNIATKIK